jgi:hypothetical protein
MRAAGRGGKFGTNSVGEAGGGGAERCGECFSDREIGKGSGGLARGLGRDGDLRCGGDELVGEWTEEANGFRKALGFGGVGLVERGAFCAFRCLWLP